MHRPREWDAVVFVDAPEPAGSSTKFVVLPDRSFLAEGDVDRTGVASIVQLLGHEPPYRAEAIRRDGSTWAVGVRSILVVELPPSVLGDDLELVWDGRERTTLVGGAPSLASVAELEALAKARFDTWVVRAERLRDAYWEVEIGPL